MATDPLAHGGNAFPNSDPQATWDSYRAKKASATWDDAIAHVNAENGFQPHARADAGARGSEWSAPPAGPQAPAAPSATNGEGSQLSPIQPQMRLSSPEMRAKGLPSPADKLYETLFDEKNEAWVLATKGFGEIDEKRTEIQRLQSSTAQRIEDNRNATVADDHPTKVATRKMVDALKSDIARMEARRAPHVEKMKSIGAFLNKADLYIQYTPIAALKAVAAVKPGKADTFEVVVDRIANIRADLGEIESKPWPSDDAKTRATAEIEYLASKGRIAMDKSIDYRNQISWPHPGETVTLRGFGHGMHDVYDQHQVPGAMAMVAWLFKDQILAKLFAEIDDAANDEIALNAEQRGGERARLNGRLLAEQRVLSAIIWRDGSFHLIPADLDPRALLGIDGPEPKD